MLIEEIQHLLKNDTIAKEFNNYFLKVIDSVELYESRSGSCENL